MARPRFELLITSVLLAPLNESLAKLAGEALAKIRQTTFVDAVVMASAAQRGDVVSRRTSAISIVSGHTSWPSAAFDVWCLRGG